MKRRPIWRILAVLAGVFVVLVGAAVTWIRSTADRKFAALEDRLRSMDAATFAPDPSPRPGKEPGNAWDDYLPALAQGANIKPPELLIGILDRTQNANTTFGEAELAARGFAIDYLRRGAARASCVPPGPSSVGNLWKGSAILSLGLLKARKLAEDGQPAEAVELRLDLCQFGRDLDAAMFGHDFLEMVFKELREDLRSPTSTTVVVAAIDARLSFLEHSLPAPERLRQKFLRMIAENSADGAKQAGAAQSLLCWRSGFSPRLMAAKVFESWDYWYQQSREADRLPWPQAQALIKDLRGEIHRTTFVGAQADYSSNFLYDGVSDRSVRVHLRLLRVAAHYRRTGEVLDLDDPFGTKLLHKESGSHLKVWSVGRNGVDEGGKGKWYPEEYEDIVLEVPR